MSNIGRTTSDFMTAEGTWLRAVKMTDREGSETRETPPIERGGCKTDFCR